MNTSSPSPAFGPILANAALGLAFLTGLAFTAYKISDSWGLRYALFDGAAGVTVGTLALLRRPGRTWPAVAGLLVAGGAVAVARLADLPQEPGPVTALALSVLIGSTVRHGDAARAVAIAAGGLAVVVGTGLTARPSASGFTAVTAVAAMAWLAGAVLGAVLRVAGPRRPAPSTEAEPGARSRRP